jgi:hypothetical protein
MRSMRLSLGVLVAVLGAALIAPAQAGSAKTIRLAWSERATVGSRTIMTFNVRSLEVNGRSWAVNASFRNTSRSTLRIRRQFAVLYGPSSVPVRRWKALPARTFRPALPATLPPGKAWSGRLSGTGATALRRTNARVRFSYFAGKALPGQPGFGWTTDHVARLN